MKSYINIKNFFDENCIASDISIINDYKFNFDGEYKVVFDGIKGHWDYLRYSHFKFSNFSTNSYKRVNSSNRLGLDFSIGSQFLHNIVGSETINPFPKENFPNTHLTSEDFDRDIEEIYTSLFSFLEVNFGEELRFLDNKFISDKTDMILLLENYNKKTQKV